MKVWIFEDNLMWSSRLVKSVQAFGHDAVLLQSIPDGEPADAAILNLSSSGFSELVPLLNAKGVFTIGHAGHKEKEILQLGRDAGVDRIATNSELTYKIEFILNESESSKS